MQTVQTPCSGNIKKKKKEKNKKGTEGTVNIIESYTLINKSFQKAYNVFYKKIA